jgi:hypothetical protein
MAHDANRRELAERISVEAERLVAAGIGPSALVAMLVAEGSADLAALAAERHHHAAMTRIAEEARRALAELSPVLRIDPRTLLAAPVGALASEGLARFCDRVLAAAAAQKPARVVLALAGFEPHDGADAELEGLATELAAHGIPVERM